MGTLLQFPSERVRRPGRPSKAGPAKVVIFPGVRFERYGDPAEAVVAPRPRGRRPEGERANVER
jgi:hypothetical protein